MEIPVRLTAVLAHRYRIESEIDTGAMATVYRARDLKHDRTVAIKVLRPEVTEAIGSDRFLREIRTTANLSHPHILPLHDSGEADGFLFYVMPFVEGESLADRLEREGQLPIEEAVQIAQEVADALAYAHDKGVIHRDIKPANILLERGHALLADFGIAQARAGADETRLTGSGMSLGTPSYMSPEQISGEGELDGRSDQYALACVLHEMLAGHPPFTGSDSQTVMRQHLAAEPPKVAGARATVPTGVAKTLHRALAKAPADRYRTVQEFEKALAGATLPLLARIPMGRARWVLFGAVFTLAILGGAFIADLWPGGDPEPSPDEDPESDLVLVLPFENRTGVREFDNLGTLAGEHITAGLNRADLIPVFPYEDAYWESAHGEEGSASGARATWARATSATMAVAGRYFDVGDSIEFRLEVLDPLGGVVTSAEPVAVPKDDPRGGLDRVQWRAVSAVAGQVAPGTPLATINLQSHLPESEALELYLEGTLVKFTEGPATGIPLLIQAMEADPDYLAPLIQLIWEYGNTSQWAKADSVCTIAEGRSAEMTRFERLDMEGGCALVHGDYRTALAKARLNLEYVPNSHNDVGVALFKLYRPREAIDAFLKKDPHASRYDWSWMAPIWRRLAQAYHLVGEYERELEVARDLEEHFPDWEGRFEPMLSSLAALGRLEELHSVLDEVHGRYPPPNRRLMWLISIVTAELGVHGQQEAARRIREEALRRYEARSNPEAAAFEDLWLWGIALLETDRIEEASRLFQPILEAYPDYMTGHAILGVIAARQGDRVEAERRLRRMAEMEGPLDRGGPEFHQAWIRANLGDLSLAMELLEKAVSDGFSDWMDLHSNPWLEPLWDYPAFQEFMRPRG